MSFISIHQQLGRLLASLALTLVLVLTLQSCAPAPSVSTDPDDLTVVGSMNIEFAQQFSVDFLANGSSLITINGSDQFLIMEEGQTLPSNVDAGMTVLQKPIQNIYLAATSAMCLFDALDALSSISMSGTKAEGWYIENAKKAMERGDIVYAGKYNAPDYEMLMAKGCGLAIESTMISHAPEVQEKLEALGIPVMVERSSYEPHPLGRTEWIKLYGLLTGTGEEAAALFDEQVAFLHSVSVANTGKSVAFFYISSSGIAVARKNGDYAVKMIELAGGNYVFTDLGDPDSATGSVNLEMERFYAKAKDADIIIYNSSIDGEVRSIDQLLAKSHLLADCKAVQTGDVWCTGKNLFQETTGFGLMIAEMNQIFTDNATDDLLYYYRLR